MAKKKTAKKATKKAAKKPAKKATKKAAKKAAPKTAKPAVKRAPRKPKVEIDRAGVVEPVQRKYTPEAQIEAPTPEAVPATEAAPTPEEPKAAAEAVPAPAEPTAGFGVTSPEVPPAEPVEHTLTLTTTDVSPAYAAEVTVRAENRAAAEKTALELDFESLDWQDDRAQSKPWAEIGADEKSVVVAETPEKAAPINPTATVAPLPVASEVPVDEPAKPAE